jgi:hypothetical protein
MARVLITDGGPHPAEEWAIVSAETVFPLDDLHGARKLAGLAAQARIAAAMLTHHQDTQDGERAALASDEDHCAAPVDLTGRLDDALADVRDAAGPEWEDHFARPDVAAAVRAELTSHLHTVAHIERLWHADRNPANQAAQAYKSAPATQVATAQAQPVAQGV